MSAPVAGRVFISYRREETASYAGRLSDRLAYQLGDDQIFMDVDTIAPGLDFAQVITQAVSTCEVLLAVIGPRWLSATDEDGQRRLEDPDDIVVLEIAAALERNIRVIPILVEGARMPRRQQLPDNLVGLARRNAFSVRHESFRADADRLLAVIEPILRQPASDAPAAPGPARAVEPPPRAAKPEPTETDRTAETTIAAPEASEAAAIRMTLERWKALAIVDRDGTTVGTIHAFYLDLTTGRPTWALLEAGLFGTDRWFVPLLEVREVEHGLEIPYPKPQIRVAPKIDVQEELSLDDQARLSAHYGIVNPRSAARRADLQLDGPPAPSAPGPASAASAGRSSRDVDHEVIDSPEALFRHLYEKHGVEEARDLDPHTTPVRPWLRRHADLERGSAARD